MRSLRLRKALRFLAVPLLLVVLVGSLFWYEMAVMPLADSGQEGPLAGDGVTALLLADAGSEAATLGEGDASAPVTGDEDFAVPSAAAATGSRLDESCPLELPASALAVSYENGELIESWEALSDETCRDFAYQVLKSLQESGATLEKADYLDLSGEAWGCAVRTAADEALTITLLPQKLFEARSESNPLRVTVIRTNRPVLL